MRFRHRLSLAILLAIMSWASPARAQSETQPVKITLYPAVQKQPPLDCRLLPGFADLIEGNAAVYYGKMKAENNIFGDRALNERAERLQTVPLEELLRQPVDVPGSDYDFYYLEQAALCDSCDWQLPFRRDPLTDFRLSEVADCRLYGRVLAVQARFAIAQRDYQTAITRLKLAYALARHASAGETFTNGLVGAAICETTSRQALELIQQPDAPSLYWSLAALPRPMIDFRKALDAYNSVFELALPELRQPEQTGRSDDQWQAALLAVWRYTCEFSGEPEWRKSPEEMVKLSLDSHLVAAQDLLTLGWRTEQLEGMPAAQVILLDAVTRGREIQNAALSSFYLPYPDAMAGLAAAKDREKALCIQTQWAVPIGPTHLFDMEACRRAAARCERGFAVLQLLEALRLHAASHGGDLPERLRDLDDVTVPDDPVTNRPFRYLREGDSARLGGPAIRLGGTAIGDAPLEYEISLKVPGE